MSAPSPGGGLRGVRSTPAAPLVAGSLIASYAVVAATGSRPAGGAVLALGGLGCIWICRQRRGTRAAAKVAAVGLAAFVVSHVLALAVGAWPSVLIVATAAGLATWMLADAEPRPSIASASAVKP